MAINKTFDLHPQPKQAVQINRPLVITVAIVISTIMLLAIVAALTSPNRAGKIASTTPATSDKVTIDKSPSVASALKDLPGSYRDVTTIKKYLSDDGANTKIAALAQQLGDLQNAYNSLKQQLEDRPDTPSIEKPTYELAPEEIRRSGLHFDSVPSDASNPFGSQTQRSPFSPFEKKDPQADKDSELVATKQQEEFFKKKNANDIKIATMKGNDKAKDIYDLHNVVRPVSPYQIMAGSVLPVSLVTGISTAAVGGGTVVAQIRENVYSSVSGKYLLIPKGSKLLGMYNTRIDYGQKRVSLGFNRIIRTDGSSILLGADRDVPLGSDSIGQAGVEGSVDNHWAKIIGATSIGAILDVGAGMASNRFDRHDAQSRGILGGAQRINATADNLVNRSLRVPPTITLPPGHPFSVIVKKDMILSPMKRR